MEKQSVQPRLWKFRIEHILDSIAKIERYTDGLSQDTFPQSEMVVDAVIRNLQIIGEATRHLPEEVQERHQAIRGRRCVGCGISSRTATMLCVST